MIHPARPARKCLPGGAGRRSLSRRRRWATRARDRSL